MLVKKSTHRAHTSSAMIVPIQGFARQLEGLYARRSAVEALIQSLEDYTRFRAERIDRQNLKTA
jgi:hypothetical protein